MATTCTTSTCAYLGPDWFQQPTTVGYAAYADRFAGDLRGVAERIDHLRDLGTMDWTLMPLLQPRSGPDDGGYAVQDDRSVRADLGTVDDLRALAARLRGEGISLCLDLVLNHVAREHEVGGTGAAGEPRYRDYFRLYRTAPSPTRGRRRCRRCSRTSCLAASPGTRRRRAGSG